MSLVFGKEHPFWGARSKVDRAKEHLDTLKDEFSEWCDRYPDGLVFQRETQEVNPDTGEFIETILFDVNPPAWGVLIGEFLHDLRTALNHLVVTVAYPPADETQFPCAATKGDYRSSWQMVENVPASYLAVIEAAQPYHRGDKPAAMLHPLRRLADLNNRDKHHLLLVTLLGLKDATGAYKSVWEHPGVEAFEFVVPGSEQEASPVVRTREQDVDMNENPAVGVVFDEPEMPTVHRHSVSPILDETLEASRKIVDEFFAAAS